MLLKLIPAMDGKNVIDIIDTIISIVVIVSIILIASIDAIVEIVATVATAATVGVVSIVTICRCSDFLSAGISSHQVIFYSPYYSYKKGFEKEDDLTLSYLILTSLLSIDRSL